MYMRPSGLLVPGRRLYEDALSLVGSSPVLEGIGRVLTPVIIVDDLRAVGFTVAQQTGIIQGPNSPGSGGSISSQGAIPIKPNQLGAAPGAIVGSGLWVPGGQALGQVAAPTAVFSASLKFPPAGWGWKIRDAIAIWETGSTGPTNPAGTTPIVFWGSPSNVAALTAVTDLGDANGNVQAPGLTPNGFAFGAKESDGGADYATATFYFAEWSQNNNVYPNLTAWEAYANGQDFTRWQQQATEFPLIVSGGGFGFTFQAGAAGNAITIFGIAVMFDWVWVGYY